MKIKIRNLLIILHLILFAGAFSPIVHAAAPILAKPANNSTCFSPNDTLIWHSVPNAAYFTVILSNSADLSNPIIIQGTQTDTSYLPTVTLMDGTQYYWRVRVLFSGGGIPPPLDSSAIWSFTTKYPAPYLSGPDDNATCQLKKTNLRWFNNPGFQFNLQVSTVSNFSSTVINMVNISSNTQDVTLPNYNTRYYWRVASVNASCTSDWSSVRSFTTAQAPPNPVSPANNSVGNSILIPLKWSATGNPLSYQVQVAPDSVFLSPVIDDFVNTTSDTINLGSFNRDYYWRVKASYTGCETDWSTVYTFKTLYTAPFLMTPRRDSLCVPLLARFEWGSVNDAASYRIQIAEDNNFNKLIFNKNKILTTSDTFSLPKGMQMYYWRVRAEDGNNSGIWSDTFRLTTAPNAPTRTFPLDKDSGGVSVIFKWSSLGTDMSYRIQISNFPDFKVNLVDQRTDLLSYPMNFANFNKTFYWRVTANYLMCQGLWSSTWEYKTMLLQPTLQAPADQSTKQSTNPKFQWSAPAGAEKYVFQLSKTINFVNVLIGRTGLPTNSFSSDKDLETSTTYFWRVYCTNFEGQSAWSKVFSFTTGGLGPDIPTLALPANNSEGLDTKIKLTWNSATRASFYHLQVSEFEDFQPSIVNLDNLTETTYTVPNLENSKSYFWRVAAINDTGKSSWSDTWTFKTLAMAPSDMSILLTPPNDTKDAPVTLNFTWSKVPRADAYEFQIANDNQFDLPTIIFSDTNLSANSKYLTDLPFNTEMFWRVRGKNEAGKGPWSDPWKFKSLINSVTDNLLAQVYQINITPNPANDLAKISFNLPKDEIVSAKIYSIIGNELVNYVPKSLIIGANSLDVDVKALYSGIYLIKVSIGNFSQTQQLIINK